MRTNLFWFRNFSLIAGTAFCLALSSTAGNAFTQEDQRRLCTGDVMRLCFDEIPNVQRITACMRRQRARLSEGCRSVFGKPTERAASR